MPAVDSEDGALTPERAALFARIALSHVEREYPSKLDHVLSGPGDLRAPSVLHPAFCGSFDWHSCVHGFWLLAVIRRRFPALAECGAIDDLFRRRLTQTHLAAELGYFEEHRSAERPYGWVWLLALAAELPRVDRDAAAAVAPLARHFAGELLRFWERLTYPIRTGTHANSAFMLLFALEAGSALGYDELEDAARRYAQRWFGDDRGVQVWEPSGVDFLSPALVEAVLMQRALERGAFARWFAAFLPLVALGEPATLFTPASVRDRGDGHLAHLDGLNLSRAWCWKRLAIAFPDDDARRERALVAAARHVDAALAHLADDYMGEHWLATYALLALAPTSHPSTGSG